MRGTNRYMTPESLPQKVAVFPLSGALLLPHGMMPLNIFEPRYLNLIEDALGSGRYIALIQPRDADSETVADDAPIYSVGCLGRITSFTESDDGHFQIILTGLCRFRTVRELEFKNSYRRIEPDYTPFLGDLPDEAGTLADRELLMATLAQYFEHGNIDVEGAGLDEMDDHTLVTTMSMACPFDPPEKQALLECTDLVERGRLLQTLLEMNSHGDEGNANTNRH